MRKIRLLYFITCLTLISFYGNAQDCTTPVFSISEDFTVANVNDLSLPDCWTSRSGNVSMYISPFNSSQNELRFYNTPGVSSIITTPLITNGIGVLNFQGRTQDNLSVSFTLYLYSEGTYYEVTTFAFGNGPTQSFSYDFSNFSSDDTKTYSIAFKLNARTSYYSTAYLDNIEYESVCTGTTAANAVTKNIDLMLDETTGEATIIPEDIDNGSADSCDDPVTLSLDKTVFNCNDLGDNTVTLTATDSQGNTDFANATVNVYTAISVEIVPDLEVVLDANGEASISIEDVDLGTTTVCGTDDISLSLSQTDFDCTDVGQTTFVTLHAVNDGPTTFSNSVSVTVLDNIDPEIIVQDITVALNESIGSVDITVDQIDNGSYDNCDLTLTLSKSSFGCNDVGVNTIKLNATDNEGNVFSADANVTVTSTVVDHAVTSSVNEFCPDGTATSPTVSIASSTVGVSYSLRNSENNATIDGPITGTGNTIDFNAGSITETTTFNVLAEPEIIPDYGLDLDGTNDKITTTYVPTATTELTIEGWIYPRSANADRILSTYNGSGVLSDGHIFIDTYDASVQNGTALRLSAVGTGGVRLAYSVPNVLQLNAWNHIACVFDNGDVKLYVDGVEVGSGTAGFTSLPSNSDPLFLGEDGVSSGGTNYFNGQMDDFRIWNTVRTATEIVANKDSRLSGTETGLSAYFNFDDGSGSTVTELVSGANGTLTNMDASTDWVDGALANNFVCGIQMSTEVTIGDSESPTVVVQNIDAQLDGSGNITIEASDVDNGSTDNCTLVENLTFVLDQATFDCSMAGENTVMLTVTDEAGNEASNTAIITVISSIIDEAVTVTEDNVCSTNDGTTISINGSVLDRFYYLRDSEDNSIVDGPIAGTGDAIDFNTGVLNGATTFNVLGSTGGALSSEASSLEFAKGNQYVAAGEDTDFAYDQGYTIETWINSAFGTANSHAILSYGTSSTSDIEIYVQGSTGYLTIVHGRVSGSAWAYSQYTTPPTSQWTHVAITYDGGIDGVTVYYDGVAQSRLTNVNPTYGLTKRSGATLNIGRSLNFTSSDDSFSGKMDEVRIWDSAKTLAELTANRDICLSGSESGLVSYFQFNEGAGTTAEDIAGGNNGTLIDMDASTDWIIESPITCEFCEFQMTTEVTVSMQDLTSPEVFTKDITVVLDDDGNASITAEEVNNNSTDDCTSSENLILSLDITAFDINNVGENTVILTVEDASGNTSTAIVIVTVSDKELQTVSFDAIADKTYGDADITITATSDSGLPMSFTVLSGSVTLTDEGTNTATVSITGAGDVTIRASNGGDDTYAATELDRTFAIAKADQELAGEEGQFSDRTFTADDFSIDLAANSSLPLVFTVVSGPATIAGDVVSLTGDLGIVEILVTQAGNDNYNAYSETFDFEVVSKDTQTITFGVLLDVTYGIADQTLSATASSALPVSLSLVSGPATLVGDQLSITGAGTVVIEASQSGNDDYLVAEPVEQSFIVSQATLVVTADDYTINYGENIPTLTYSYSGFVNGEDESYLSTIPTIAVDTDGNAGTYDITLSTGGGSVLSEVLLSTVDVGVKTEAADNYNLTLANGTLTINKLDLIVTADDQGINYGEAVPTLTYSYSGFVNGEDESYLSTIPTIAVDTDGNAGTYDITLSTGGGFILSEALLSTVDVGVKTAVVDNYNLTLVNGTLTISKLDLTVTADDQDINYGEAVPTLTYSYYGFVNGEDESYLSTLPTIAVDTDGDAGTYDITLSTEGFVLKKDNLLSTVDVDPINKADNYSLILVDGTLTISQLTAQITISDVEQDTDGSIKTPTVVTNPVDLSYTITYDGSSIAPTTAGSYAVLVEIDEINYIGSANATLVLNKITLDTQSSVETNITVYPNPISSKINIEVSHITTGSIRLFDIHGVDVMRGVIANGKGQYDLSDLKGGVYIIDIYDDQAHLISRQKVIVK